MGVIMSSPLEINIPNLELEGFSESAARRVETSLKRELELALNGKHIDAVSKTSSGGVLQLSERDISDPSRLGKALAKFILARVSS